MDDEIIVPHNIISAISESMEGRQNTHSRNLTEDNTIVDCVGLKKGLKEGRVPGSAVIEWEDEGGNLRLNIIDFLVETKCKAIDPDSGESIIVKPSDIPDGSWRLLY